MEPMSYKRHSLLRHHFLAVLDANSKYLPGRTIMVCIYIQFVSVWIVNE